MMNVRIDVVVAVLRDVRHHSCTGSGPQLHLESVDKLIQMIIAAAQICRAGEPVSC